MSERERALVLALALAIGATVACYDLDRLRADRDHPLDDGGGSDGAVVADAGADVDGGADAGGVCPLPLPAPTTGLAAFYPLDETSGVVVDDCSGNGLDGVVIASSAEWTTGKHGGGLRVSPILGCAQLGRPDSASALDFTSSFSVTAWINVTAFPSGSTAGYVVGKTHDPDVGGWRLAVGAGTVNGSIALSSKVRLDLPAPIGGGTWVHVALVVVAGGTISLFVNGTQSASKPGVPMTLVPDAAAAARIGCRSDGTEDFDGVVDDVRIFSRALTAQEIATIAN